MKRLVVMAVVVLTFAIVAGSGAMVDSGASLASHQRGLLRLSGSPGLPVANPRTHTLYVPLQCRDGQRCSATAEHVMAIIDTSRCNSGKVSGCRVVGKAQVGRNPLASVMDEKTDTVYVIDATGAVSVVDGGRCNALVRRHCGTLATIRTGGFDVAGVLNPRTHTLYVAAPSGDVFVIDVARCNARTTQGCHQHVRKVKDPRGPDAVDVDLSTNTVYVADDGANNDGHTITVINGATCNGSVGRGCRHALRKIAAGAGPWWLTVDQRTNTIYVANNADGTVSVIDGATCNRKVSSGCSREPRSVPTGAGASFLVVDRSRHTVFVMNGDDGTISEINTRTCNGQRHSGCPGRARNERATFDTPTGYNPSGFALVPSTGTAYLVNVGGQNFLAPIGIGRCSALRTAGCRVEAPTVPLDLAFPVVDPNTDTIYAANAEKPGIVVMNGATCNAHDRSGCAPVATIPFPHPQANLGSIDQATHTLYAADVFGDKLFAIDIKHCNAKVTSSCSKPSAKITVGPGPNIPVLNSATHTLYVTAGKKENLIYAIDSSKCNAQVSSGCGQPPATIKVAPNSYFLDVSPVTDTIYVTPVNWPDHEVWVVNGAGCNAGDHSGCSHAVVAKAQVGLDPLQALVNDSSGTVYVANNANGDLPGTVSVINGATCNGSVTTSCARAKPNVTVGRSPVALAVDDHTGRVYVADFSSATVSSFDGSHCDAADASGCGKPARARAVGSQPGLVWLNPKEGTVYAATHDLASGGSGWSMFPTSP